MKTAKFDVTFDIVTEESAEYGEAEESGYVCENERLGAAINQLLSTNSNTVDGANIEHGDRYISVQNGMDWVSGEHETRTLHRPKTCTNATWNRICRAVHF